MIKAPWVENLQGIDFRHIEVYVYRFDVTMSTSLFLWITVSEHERVLQFSMCCFGQGRTSASKISEHKV